MALLSLLQDESCAFIVPHQTKDCGLGSLSHCGNIAQHSKRDAARKESIYNKTSRGIWELFCQSPRAVPPK